jgi:hypothetical protein
VSEPTLPEAHPTLGARQLHARKVVEGGSGKRFAGGALLAISVFLFLGMGGAGLLVGIGGALQGDAAAGGITATAFLCVGLAAALVPGAIGALLLRAGRAVQAHVEEVAVHASGVMTKTGDQNAILHWGEVQGFMRSPAQGRISVLTTDLPLMFVRLEAEGDRAIEVRATRSSAPSARRWRPRRAVGASRPRARRWHGGSACPSATSRSRPMG